MSGKRDRMIKAIPVTLLLLLLAPFPAPGADAPFGIDLKELDRPQSALPAREERENRKKERRSGKKMHRVAHAPRPTGKNGAYLRYTVKPGDHLFKILAGRLGMPEERAEQLIPAIQRINKIRDIRNLTVGQTLLIPYPAPTTSGEAVAVKEPATVLAATKASSAGTPVAPATPAPSRLSVAAPPAAALICPVPEQDPAAVIDSLLRLLRIDPGRNKTVEAGQGTGTPFSITVDRYFEYQGGRYIVSIGESDPYSYTLLRVMERTGYKVLRLSDKEGFHAAADRLLTMVGVAPDFGRHRIEGEKRVTGFLIKTEGTGGRRVVVSAVPVEAGEKWPLAPECGAR